MLGGVPVEGHPPQYLETTREPRTLEADQAAPEPVLVLAHHAMLARVGETIAVAGGRTEISRLAPPLVDAQGRATAPLDDPFVSRRPIGVRRLDGGAIEIDNPGVELSVGGAAVPAGRVHRVGAGELAAGVPVVLGGRVLLWLTTDHDPRGGPELGMIGCSAAMRALRAQIRDAADVRGPVLVTGETGSGKELVARALHASGPRAGGPYVGVNVAAIPAAVAAAELFGHERGAFTGATERRAGYFERAHGGVVFLDEIGDLPEAIQPVVLRALESGEIQPVGGAPRRVDVAVVAATDADLPAAVRAGRFRGPLYHRLASTVIRVPPLRERGADVALLLARMLREALPDALTDRTTDPALWLPATLVAALIRARWPGNIRQLRNVAHRLAAIARVGRTATLEQLGLDELDDGAGEAPSNTAARRTAAAPGAAEARAVAGERPGEAGEPSEPGAPEQIDEDRLVATLRAHRFQLSRTAAALGVSRTHLDALIARSSRVRKANQLLRDEIAACLAELGGDLDAVAARLEVSPRGLRLRMTQLGM